MLHAGRVILPGGNGFIGACLAQRFADLDHEVHILTRHPRKPAHQRIHFVLWDGKTLGDWQKLFEGAAAVINLAGRSVDCRYHERNKREILLSRLDSTRVIGEAIQSTANQPRVWINAASATIYVDTRGTAPANTEREGKIGTDFSMTVCHEWEKIFNETLVPGTRKLLLRMAIVLGPTGGAFIPLVRLARFGLGGPMGDGQQYVSWIHLDDLWRVLLFLLDHPQAEGVYNCASPNPVTNAELMKTFRNTVGRGWGLPAPAWLLELGAFFLRTETELLLKSRKVAPARLLQEGFVFEHTRLDNALTDLFSNNKNRDNRQAGPDSGSPAPTRKETAK